jgi:hypothetical protein
MLYIEIIEKIFPEVTKKVNAFPLRLRLIFALLLFGFILLFSAINIAQLMQNNKKDILAIVAIITAILILIYIGLELFKIIKRKILLIQFVKTWKEYTKFWFVFHIKIESYLRRGENKLFDHCCLIVFRREKTACIQRVAALAV